MSEETPRNPRDLQALLKFCLNATQSEDAPDESAYLAMDEDRRNWLRNALDGMSVDVFQELAKGIEILSQEDKVKDPLSNIDEQLDALDCIEDWIGQIDMANNFHKLGGFVGLEVCLSSVHETLKSQTCHIIAELAQNNIYCQEKLVEEGFLDILLEMIHSSSVDLKAKTLYSISSIVRDCPVGERKFKERNGLNILLEMLQNEDKRILTKSCFLLSSLCITNTNNKIECTKMGFLQILISILQGMHENFHEHVARCLFVMSVGNEEALTEIRKKDHNLQKLLNDKIIQLHGKEEYEDEVNHYRDLIKLYFPKGVEVVER